MKFLISDEQEMLVLGKKIAEILPEKVLVFFNGPLGAGKTTLVRGILLAAGHQGSTKSPTYTLVEPYEIGNRQFYHFDLYRLGDPEELEYIGIRDYLDEESVCLVEWPEKGEGILPEPDLILNLNYEGEARSITLNSQANVLSDTLSAFLTKRFKAL